MEMMQRAATLADEKAVGAGNCRGDVGFCRLTAATRSRPLASPAAIAADRCSGAGGIFSGDPAGRQPLHCALPDQQVDAIAPFARDRL